jgi:hypothetical protein
MPNWCNNSVTLHNSDKSKIDALDLEMSKKDDRGSSLGEPFLHLRPRPIDQEENWYDWNISNWGTKWEASVIDWCRDSDNELTIYFDSAWSPPIALYEYLVQEGWGVTALYNEPGMAYAGMYEDGADDYYEYDIADLESIEVLPEDVIEFGNLREEHEYWKENNCDDETEVS